MFLGHVCESKHRWVRFIFKILFIVESTRNESRTVHQLATHQDDSLIPLKTRNIMKLLSVPVKRQFSENQTIVEYYSTYCKKTETFIGVCNQALTACVSGSIRTVGIWVQIPNVQCEKGSRTAMVLICLEGMVILQLPFLPQ